MRALAFILLGIWTLVVCEKTFADDLVDRTNYTSGGFSRTREVFYLATKAAIDTADDIYTLAFPTQTPLIKFLPMEVTVYNTDSTDPMYFNPAGTSALVATISNATTTATDATVGIPTLDTVFPGLQPGELLEFTTANANKTVYIVISTDTDANTIEVIPAPTVTVAGSQSIKRDFFEVLAGERRTFRTGGEGVAWRGTTSEAVDIEIAWQYKG